MTNPMVIPPDGNIICFLHSSYDRSPSSKSREVWLGWNYFFISFVDIAQKSSWAIQVCVFYKMTACQKHINSSHESPGHPSINQGRRSRNTVVRGKLGLKSEELVWTLCVWMAILGTQRGQQRQETLPRQLNNVSLYILCLIKCKIKHSSRVSKWQYSLNDVNLHHTSQQISILS